MKQNRMSKTEQPRNLLIYGEPEHNATFIDEWLNRYEEENVLDRRTEIYWYSKDPRERSYDHKRIAIFKEMNTNESYFDVRDTLNIEIMKLRLINPHIVILITSNSSTLNDFRSDVEKDELQGILAISSDQVDGISKLFKILKFKHSY